MHTTAVKTLLRRKAVVQTGWLGAVAQAVLRYDKPLQQRQTV